MRNSKHKAEYDRTSDEDHELLPKHSHRHHKRKHKKHKCRGEETDCSRSKNNGDETPDRNEVIEIHDSSSEHGSRNYGKYCDDHDKRLESHTHKHRRKEERRHGKRRKKSRSTSRSRDRDVEMPKSHCRKLKNDDGKSRRYASSSDSDIESSNEGNRRKKYAESSSNGDREFEGGKSRDAKNRSEVDKKSRSQFDYQGRESRNVREDSRDEQDNDRGENESRNRREHINQEPSGSRSSGTKKREHKEESWGRPESKPSKKSSSVVQKPNFGLSGKLAEDTNVYNGVVIKYSEPPEARMPKRRWRLYPFKGDSPLPPLYIHRQSAYLLGRDRKVVDMPIDHPSCSKQHAALQYRLVSYERSDGSVGKAVRLYIIDLESANGTFINNKKIEAKKYVELFEKDVIKFGYSSREYVLLHEHSVDSNADET